MPESYQIVSKFMNMFGSMWVVGTSMTSAVLTLAMVPKLFVNQIQCGQDIMLGFSHFMIMFFVFRVDKKVRWFYYQVSISVESFITIADVQDNCHYVDHIPRHLWKFYIVRMHMCPSFIDEHTKFV
uniref:Uncharacterized protein n=1 Tax=Romanomermis culicivorax TaxID=13658 RepID=A0A915IYD7_ROMCU